MNAMPSVSTTDTSELEAQEPRRLDVDVLVIGWGKGGKTFAGKMAAAGKSVVMVEQSAAMYGGTCINIGCVPTKTLIHSASEKRAADGDQKFFEDAVDYRDSLIGKLNDVNFHMLADQDTVTVVDGRACFVGPAKLRSPRPRVVVAWPNTCASPPKPWSSTPEPRLSCLPSRASTCREFTTPPPSSTRSHSRSDWQSSAAGLSAWSSLRCSRTLDQRSP